MCVCVCVCVYEWKHFMDVRILWTFYGYMFFLDSQSIQLAEHIRDFQCFARSKVRFLIYEQIYEPLVHSQLYFCLSLEMLIGKKLAVGLEKK